jgi:hypothetical protein
MNCQEFLSNIDGLARGALLDARTRDDAATHEGSCGVCASRLADERALTAGLRALAAKMSDAETPARAEVALLSAFRSHAAAAAASTSSTTPTPSNVVSLSQHAGERHWSWVKTVAVAALAAAAAVALFMLVPPYLSSPLPAKESAAEKSQGASIQTTGGAAAAASAGLNETARAVEGQGGSSSQSTASTTSKGVDEDGPSQSSTPRRNVVRGMNVGYNSTRGASSNKGTLAESADAREITTEFIPLVQNGGFAQSEGMHLVRVELPRSALSSFGIPVNAEQSGGRVKADVLLGEDGTARAIRFVR